MSEMNDDETSVDFIVAKQFNQIFERWMLSDEPEAAGIRHELIMTFFSSKAGRPQPETPILTAIAKLFAETLDSSENPHSTRREARK